MSSTPIQITGNLTRDPELHYLPTSGRAVARFDVAVNARRRTEAGDWVDGETTYYPCSAWGEVAEHLTESLTRGARVVVLGRIGARSWTPTEGERAGQTFTRLEVTADEVAASLRWATATLVKSATGGRDRAWDSAPVTDEANGEEPPF